MDWTKSYSAQWRVYRVNRRTWADAEIVSNVDSVSVTRTADGSLLESGSISVTGELPSDYYRIVMTAEQNGDVQRVDVATLLFDVTGGEHNYGTQVQESDGFSVLYPASTTVVLAGEYAPAGVDGAKYAADLLEQTINAPVEIEGGFTLNDHVVHEIGSTVLEAVWAVLDAGNYIIQIDGRGVVHIRPRPTTPALVLDNSSMKMLSNGIKYTNDVSEIPNRYIVLVDNIKTIAVNNDENSSVSILSRGYYVDEVDESPTPIDGETLAGYANRKLHESSILYDEREYTREYADGVYLYSIVKASINGLAGDYRVTGQSIDCGYGIKVEEKAVGEINLW